MSKVNKELPLNENSGKYTVGKIEQLRQVKHPYDYIEGYDDAISKIIQLIDEEIKRLEEECKGEKNAIFNFQKRMEKGIGELSYIKQKIKALGDKE